MSVTSILGDPVRLLARDAVPVNAPTKVVADTTPETVSYTHLTLPTKA